MTGETVSEVLSKLVDVRVAVLGDFYLDIDWRLDSAVAEEDAATGLDTFPVRGQSYSLGGAGNVVHNLMTMGCVNLSTFGVMGADPWGRELRRLLRGLGVETRGLITQEAMYHTPAAIRPIEDEEVLNRLTFGDFNRVMDETAEQFVAMLEEQIAELDVVVIHQQLKPGIHNRYTRHRLGKLMERHPETLFVLDSLIHAEKYPQALLMVNDLESLQLTGVEWTEGVLIPREQVAAAAGELARTRQKPVVVTRGARGVFVDSGTAITDIPGIQLLGRTDATGAGDAMLAGLAGGLACGLTPGDAARFGNFAASIAVGKLGEPGAPTPEQIRAVGRRPAYIYHPEEAEDPRRARHLPDTEIEVLEEPAADFRATHVVFDHDGTVTTLRQGWEAIMEPMMVKAILGPTFESADEGQYHRVLHQVRQVIDETAGMQTILQMDRLERLVREFGFVPKVDILDAAGYKAIYADGLMDVVADRLVRLGRGERDVQDFTIKHVPELLEALHKAGVKLYLFSSADQVDVEREARALGVASYFTRVVGAAHDGSREAKRQILDRVLDEIGDASGGLVTFGDGPVEMRETRNAGGLAIGVAADEVRRFGLNPAKRSRLIRAGASVIVPDYSQHRAILTLLGVG